MLIMVMPGIVNLVQTQYVVPFSMHIHGLPFLANKAGTPWIWVTVFWIPTIQGCTNA